MKNNELQPRQKLQIIELADAQKLESPEFIVEEILRGGMGVCARIRNHRSGMIYALKAINSELLVDEHAWQRWQREMRVWLQLSAHSGVVPAYCICRINQIPCVAAKWMEGGNLRPRLIERHPTLFYQTALRVARTLQWAYSQHGVVHRDLKPENLLLSKDGVVSVADWGLARLDATLDNPRGLSDRKPDSGTVSPLTQIGMFLGTVIYASPEQIRGQSEIDHRSDIYSLGCVLFEWESGRPPFIGGDLHEIAHLHLQARPPKLGGFLRKTAFGAESVIFRCLEKNPADRFKDYSELITALEAAAAKRRVAINNEIPTKQYTIAPIGHEAIREALGSGAGSIPKAIGRDGRFGLVEFSNIEPFIREANVLLGLNEWAKAEQILAPLYIPDFPLTNEIVVPIAVSYALCLVNLGRSSEALKILDRFSAIKNRPCESYVNHCLALIHCANAQQAERVAQEGLMVFSNDPDLLGNLAIAQLHQSKLPEALTTVRRRLAIRRDVHALEEAAGVLRTIATGLVDRDLPTAANHYWEAAKLLQEARASNPRFLTARASLAGLLVDLGWFSEALEEVSSISEQQPTHDVKRSLAINAARALDRTAAHRDCFALCDDWLKTFPGDIEIQRIRAETIVDGFCIGKERDGVRIVEPTSLAFFEKAVAEHAKRLTSDILYLARLREWMGNASSAKSLVAEARAERPDWWEPPFVLGGFEWREGNLKVSIELMRLATSLAPWQTKP